MPPAINLNGLRGRRAIARGLSVLAILAAAGSSTPQPRSPATAEERVLALVRQDAPYALVPGEIFERLGWDLPDAGRHVQDLASSAPGSAFDPTRLETFPAEKLGYRATWHVVRYSYYGLEWDITGLYLLPGKPLAGLPTVAFINGGSANWYEFFVDPLNGPAVGQYLAQKIPVLLITIPGNYKPGGWTDANAARKPAYLLDRDLGAAETRARNAIFTFTLIAEGVRRLVERVTSGPLLIAGHSTGGELQFLLKEKLQSRLRDRSLGWGTGGPAVLRHEWERAEDPARRSGGRSTYPPIAEVRARTPREYAQGYVGPLNPLAGGTALDVAERWFEREGRRRPHFKQVIQDLEHTGQIESRAEVEAEIRAAIAEGRVPVNADAVIADLWSTMRPPLQGYKKMIWTTAALDDGHWDRDPEKARELFVANQFRQRNLGAAIRVLVFDVPMTHYGHIERPRQLAGGLLAAVRWLYEGD